MRSSVAMAIYAARRRVAVAESAELQSSSLRLICPTRRSSAASESPIGAEDLRHELGVEPNGWLLGSSHQGDLLMAESRGAR
jgi:hypothetical protein